MGKARAHPAAAPDIAGVVGAPNSDPARFGKISIHAGSESGAPGAVRGCARKAPRVEARLGAGGALTIRASRLASVNDGCWHGVPALAGRTSCRLKVALLAKAGSWEASSIPKSRIGTMNPVGTRCGASRPTSRSALPSSWEAWSGSRGASSGFDNPARCFWHDFLQSIMMKSD